MSNHHRLTPVFRAPARLGHARQVPQITDDDSNDESDEELDTQPPPPIPHFSTNELRTILKTPYMLRFALYTLRGGIFFHKPTFMVLCEYLKTPRNEDMTDGLSLYSIRTAILELEAISWMPKLFGLLLSRRSAAQAKREGKFAFASNLESPSEQRFIRSACINRIAQCPPGVFDPQFDWIAAQYNSFFEGLYLTTYTFPLPRITKEQVATYIQRQLLCLKLEPASRKLCKLSPMMTYLVAKARLEMQAQKEHEDFWKFIYAGQGNNSFGNVPLAGASNQRRETTSRIATRVRLWLPRVPARNQRPFVEQS